MERDYNIPQDHNFKLSRGMHKQIELAMHKLPPNQRYNEQKILEQLSNILVNSYGNNSENNKSFNYQTERMGIHTTEDLRKAIRQYFELYHQTN